MVEETSLNTIKILGGIDKDGISEKFSEIEISLGETVSIVGPTGSGKTVLISDIEMLAQGDSISKRVILIDNKVPSDKMRYVTKYKPVSMISQNTKCISDLSVSDFLTIHCKARRLDTKNLCDEVIDLANTFTGEKVKRNDQVTVLSGGQTRSLLIADAILIGSAKIIILDEIENAGIDKEEVISTLNICAKDKMLVFVTHDPGVALLCKKRLVLKNGAIDIIKNRGDQDLRLMEEIMEYDNKINLYRDKLRRGVY